MDNRGRIQPYRAESLVVGNQMLRLPRRTAALLYLSDKRPDNVSSGFGIGITITFIDGQPEVRTLSPSEPSTIYLKMCVKKPTNEQGIAGPGYYPTYAGLSAEQKWIYLNWLRDVAKPPIDIGYLFVTMGWNANYS